MTTSQASNLQATGSTNAAGRLLSALKANMGLSSANEGLFAGLLAQTDKQASEPRVDVSLPANTSPSREPAQKRDPSSEATATAARSDEAPRRSENHKDHAKKTERKDRGNDEAAQANEDTERAAQDVATQDKTETQAEAAPVEQAAEDAPAMQGEEKADPDETRMMELLAALCPLDGEASVAKSDKTGQPQKTDEKAATAATETEAQATDPAFLLAMRESRESKASEKEGEGKARTAIANALHTKAEHRSAQPLSVTGDAAQQETLPLQDAQAAFAALASGQTEKGDTKSASNNPAQNAQTPGPATTASTQPVVDAQSAIPAQGLLQQSSAPQKAAAGSAVQDIAKIATSSNASTNTTPAPSGAGVRATGFDFASQLSAMRAAKTTPTSTPQAIEQVAVQLNKMAKDGQDEITIHLKPADLGKIEIKLEIRADKTVQGTIVAESQSTLNLLSKDASSLQRALLDAGLQADAGSLSFSLKGDNQNAFAQQNQQNGSGRGMSFAMSSDSADEMSQLAASTANDDAMLAMGRVNLRV